VQPLAVRRPFAGQQAQADDVDALGAVVVLLAEAAFFGEADFFVQVERAIVVPQHFAAELVQTQLTKGQIERSDQDAQPGAGRRLRPGVEAPEGGGLFRIELGEVDDALGCAGGVVVEVNPSHTSFRFVALRTY